MSIDEAVQEKIESVIEENELCDKTKVEEIAQAIAKDIYSMFQNEISEIKRDLDKQRERQDRLWDHIFGIRPVKTSWIKRVFFFWRKYD